MQKDAIPNTLYSDHQRANDRYVVILENSKYHQDFAGALKLAEELTRAGDGLRWGVYRLDTTLQLVNGVTAVRSAE